MVPHLDHVALVFTSATMSHVIFRFYKQTTCHTLSSDFASLPHVINATTCDADATCELTCEPHVHWTFLCKTHTTFCYCFHIWAMCFKFSYIQHMSHMVLRLHTWKTHHVWLNIPRVMHMQHVTIHVGIVNLKFHMWKIQHMWFLISHAKNTPHVIFKFYMWRIRHVFTFHTSATWHNWS